MSLTHTQVLEALSSGQTSRAISLATSTSSTSVSVSEQVLLELVRACLGEEGEGEDLLTALKYALPPRSPQADLAYDLAVSEVLKRNHADRCVSRIVKTLLVTSALI